MNVVYMPTSAERYKYIVFTRDDLSGGVEGRALQTLESLVVARFCSKMSGIPQQIVLDNGTENFDFTKSLLEHCKAKLIKVSPYHPYSITRLSNVAMHLSSTN